ncbi:hypothetical protein QJS10_CPB18g01582 [Acorus calamus]|uniref:SLH domain-containing protein n=1 Tax=Acorus calamus TaxID=4465 RepID=A0AAV9CKY6_ACOCL|nr:hypothetical protein QJS10_CPB18g01582 [Acorus calamus]
MACLTIHSSPNAIRMKLGPRFRKSSSIHLRMRLLPSYRRSLPVSSSSAAADDDDVNGKSWMNSDLSDGLAGWFGADSGDGSWRKPGFAVASIWITRIAKIYAFIERMRKLKGVMGAGVAAVIFAVGVAFASFSFRSGGVKQQMEPLTSQQDALLNSDDSCGKEDQVSSDTYEIIPNKESLENNLKTEYQTDRNGIDVLHNASSQEDLQIIPAVDDSSAPTSSYTSSNGLLESKTVNGSSNASTFKDPHSDIVSNTPDSFESVDTDSKIPIATPPEGISIPDNVDNPEFHFDSSNGSGSPLQTWSLTYSNLVPSESDAIVDSQVDSIDVPETFTSICSRQDADLYEDLQLPFDPSSLPSKGDNQMEDSNSEINSRPLFESPIHEHTHSYAGKPAPSVVSAVLQVPPGKIVVPAVVDQVQGQALAALQVLKVIEADVRPGDVCTRREYARWLVFASGALSKNSASKVYPAMYIENVTQLAFDDITPGDPDFASIQGLAEAGLIQSRLSGYELNDSLDGEQGSIRFFPESPLSRQDLVSWKMALVKSRLQEVDKKTLYQCSGYMDIDRINPDAWPALVADLSAGEQGITALAFGYTRLFQPNKPVTKAQAAIALATGDAAEVVGEELARIEAESMAETAVATHTALVAQVENDLNASFEKELAREKEKIDAVEKLAEESRQELEKLRAEREEENNALLRGHAAVESEMEVLSRLRGAVEEQLQSLTSNKIEISYERERINKLREEVESENQVIIKLQYELEVERKALSMARAWAEEESRRAREQAIALEEARERWESHGIKVIVDSDLREDANVGTAWPNAGKPSPVDGAINRAENLVVELKAMVTETKGRSLAAIETVIQKVTVFISVMKRHASEASAIAAGRARELQSTVVLKANESTEEFRQNAVRVGSSVKEGATRIVGDCRESIERITQRFKT